MDSDDKNPDAALHVRFQMISVFQTYDSANPLLPDGKPNPNYTGSPVYKDIPHIQITTPGGLNGIVEQVRNDHKARFPKHWSMFQMSQGGGDDVVGTKLAEWPAITRSRAEELRAMKYYVVEQIAAASDAQVGGLGMDGKMLQQKAQRFLEIQKKTAVADTLSAENARKDAQIAAQNDAIAKLQEQMAALVAAQTAAKTEPEAPKRRGRPPKATQPETPVTA